MELVYHYLWKYKMAGRPVQTVDGQSVEILSPGVHNDNSGPDFHDASIKIGGQQWVGNVEIHVKGSDWYRHGHDADHAYDSVILHVVAIDDRRALRPDGSEIPTAVVVLPENFYATYSMLSVELKQIRCVSMLSKIPDLVKEDWLCSLGIERLHFKANRILDYYSALNSDWEQTMFTAFARGLGFGLNGQPFEMLARSLPLKYVYHHADDLMQVEALLLGQAGMLDSSRNIFDEYYQHLCREYAFMARKYGLRPMRGDLWKYARTRPQNFPHRRIALLARALHEGFKFMGSLLDSGGDPDSLEELFSWILTGYWRGHGGFGEEGKIKTFAPTGLSRASKELLMINVAAPFYYAYGHVTGDYDLAERGADILCMLKPERNNIISSWNSAGIKAHDAMRSQALVHLRTEYCDRGRCLDCRFGHYLLRCGAGGRIFNYDVPLTAIAETEKV